MPTCSRGDIFRAAQSVALTVVFGHVGYNIMRLHWEEFAKGHPQFPQVNDPFSELAEKPLQWADGRWLWFIAEQENHGMTEEQLEATLQSILAWASANGIKTVATNGIADVDHDHDTAANRESDERRTRWLVQRVSAAEKSLGLAFHLVSHNDIFVRRQWVQ